MTYNNETTITVRAISEEEAMEALKGAHIVSQTKKSKVSALASMVRRTIKALKKVVCFGD